MMLTGAACFLHRCGLSWDCYTSTGTWPQSPLSMRAVIADTTQCRRNGSDAPATTMNLAMRLSTPRNSDAAFGVRLSLERWIMGLTRPASSFYIRYEPDVTQRGGLWAHLNAQQQQATLELESRVSQVSVGSVFNPTSFQYDSIYQDRCNCRYSLPGALQPRLTMYGPSKLAAKVRDLLTAISSFLLWLIIAKEGFKLFLFFTLFMRAATRRSYWIHFFSKHALVAPFWLLYGRAYRETYLSPTLPDGASDSSVALRAGLLDFFAQTIPMLIINICVSLADRDSGYKVSPLTVVTLLFNSINALVSVLLLVRTCTRAFADAKHEMKGQRSTTIVPRSPPTNAHAASSVELAAVTLHGSDSAHWKVDPHE